MTAFAFPVIRLEKGLVINSSVTVSRETYFLNAEASLQNPLMVIKGNNITVDFNNCVLQGSNDKKLPDEFYGLAVLITKGSFNIVIKNANIHGFKIALMADSVDGLQVENCDLSYNYRQHLHSNWKREDVSDWMSYHHNEHDEWMRYGAGIYMKDCNRCTIKNNVITGGQCGLMMMRCDSNEIYNNNFSFNSGIGIGLYRSSGNKIYANQLDFNVRGYSDSMYSRGQDSAGILVFEQCNNNVFANNFVTHSGDGFFLWAGQYTMDTGEGGCNDNLIFGNDFSYAPTNGVEVTFSRNAIEWNRIKECDNGIWGGYSYRTTILHNQFSRNKTAIAIEHGQQNGVLANSFANDKTAIKLWSREKQPADWGYARNRDTRSRNYFIWNNFFDSVTTVYDLMGTDSIRFSGNRKENCTTIFKTGERITNLDTSSEGRLDIIFDFRLDERLKELRRVKSSPRIERDGRDHIRITEWGPYDFRYPLLWLKNIDSVGVYHFEILTPTRSKKSENSKLKSGQIKAVGGFHINQNLNNDLTATADSSVKERYIRLEYTGAPFTDKFGKQYAGKEPYVFEYREFDPNFHWNIQFFKWDSIHDPQKDYSSFAQSLTAPIYSTTASQIDFTWWGSISKALPTDSFATVASASVNLKEGDYTFGLTADDMAKVFVDGKEVINAWDPSYTDLDENTHHEKAIHLIEGLHEFKIVHAEIGGLATLMFYFSPVR